MALSERLPRTPLTPRGWLLLALALYLLLGPGRHKADIVASAFAFGMLAFVLLLLGAIMLQTGQITRNFRVKLSVPERLYSGEAQHCALTLPALRMLPLIVLDLRLVFRQAGARSLRHLIGGRWDNPRVVPELITFPHRGEWGVWRWRLAVTDRLGLTCWHWTTDQWDGPVSVTVLPTEASSADLPLLSSATRSGEDMVEQHTASGEPFDLKPYHPADGMKKIVWKVYAKTRQLISRHPERAMTPEGKVVMFALAGKTDDNACGIMLDYCRRAASFDLSLIAGCLGMGARAVAAGEAEITKLLLDCVWESTGGLTRDGLEGFLDGTERELAPSRCSRLLVFSSEERLSGPAGTKEVELIGSILQSRGIEPVFFVSSAQEQRKAVKQTLVSRFLFGRNGRLEAPTPNGLPVLCGARGWGVHRVRAGSGTAGRFISTPT